MSILLGTSLLVKYSNVMVEGRPGEDVNILINGQLLTQILALTVFCTELLTFSSLQKLFQLCKFYPRLQILVSLNLQQFAKFNATVFLLILLAERQPSFTCFN